MSANEWLKLVLPGALGLLTAVFAAMLSARWAVRRAYQEKWWEKKHQAYSEIIESLHDHLRHADLCAQEYMSDRSDEAKSKEFAARSSEAHWRIKKAIDMGSLMITSEAIDILKALYSRKRLKWEENSPLDIYDEDCDHYRKAIQAICKIARHELT